ncbi:NB-ARC domains-containing protein [Artemisia annua]|uniref:NB-ARC domains-containing protein n=1 Tax=Artemisia annua TaxID=35608 RepID=A0A2U1KKD0_ARTAN|nr:NB-ARC domains-containing protein [Artemisia annua]
MTYTGLELFMENLKQLIYSNDNPLINNHPSILSERPQLQLLYDELDSMIQILFHGEHTELQYLKRRFKRTAEEAQYIIDLFVSGVHCRKLGYSPRPDVFRTFLNLDHVMRSIKSIKEELIKTSMDNMKIDSSQRTKSQQVQSAAAGTSNSRSTLGSKKLLDEIVVGLDHHVELIRDKLVEDQKQLDVISIVGMGGLDLVNLRHLSSNKKFYLPSINRPMNLQTISEVELGDLMSLILNSDEGNDFELLPCLETLKLTGIYRRKLIEPEVPKCEPNCRNNQISFPTTLKKLTLVGCHLPWSDMSIIQSLPNLEVLKVKDYAFDGTLWKTGGREEQFQRLRFLRLERLDIEKWEAYSINFPCLKQLEIVKCCYLREIPLEIGDIPTLELIKLDSWSYPLVESMKRIQEEQHNEDTDIGSKKLFDEIVVGLDHHVEVIRDKLVEDQKQLDVVSIVGMGGIGKTTLATKVFNDRFITYHFGIRAWVTVSQRYKKRDVLIQILASLGVEVDIENTNDFKLREMLHKSLKGQRYLIVIDDIWSKEAWDNLKGRPLSVVVIAGLLAKEPENIDLWKTISCSVASYIAGDENKHMETLVLSYNHLPPHLKECFLYLGGFPEDFKFYAQRVIRLWVAEGFIQEAENQSFEDIGEAYLMDLVGRNLVIVAERTFNGDISFLVHDLVREMCLKKALEERFFLKINSAASYAHSEVITSYKIRRLFTHQNTYPEHSITHLLSQVQMLVN